MRRRFVPHLVNVALLFLLFAGSLWVYPALPEEIPRHFGAGGEADAYWKKSLGTWLLLPIIAIATVILTYVHVLVVHFFPLSALNFPKQDRLDDLSDADKREIRRRMHSVIYWIATPVITIFLALQYGTYRVATTNASTLPELVVAIEVGSVLAILGIVAVLIWRLPAWIEAQHDPS